MNWRVDFYGMSTHLRLCYAQTLRMVYCALYQQDLVYQSITDADYADDIALLANAPAQAESLQLSLERAAAGIGLHVNAHQTEYMF